MSCSSISSCGRIKATVDCLTNIYQGGDYELEIQLVDTDGTAANLDEYLSIYIAVFDSEDCVRASFAYPDVTGSQGITILQETDTDGAVLNEGKFIIRLTSALTAALITGQLSAEIKLEILDTDFEDGSRAVIIPCLKLGTVKYSKINAITEDPPAVTLIESFVTSVFGRVGDVLAADGDYNAGQISITGTSNLSSDNVGDGLEELYTLIQSAGQVDSVFGRTGVVVAADGDYEAEQISLATGTGLAASNVYDALAELKVDIDGITFGNFADTDLAIDDNRVHDFQDFSLVFENIGNWTFNSTEVVEERGTAAGGTINYWQVISQTSSELSSISVYSNSAGTSTYAALNSTGSIQLTAEDGILLFPSGGNAPQIRFREVSGSEYVSIQGPAAVSGNITWILPDADSVGTQALVSDGSGNLGWADLGGSAPIDTVFGRTGDVIAVAGDYQADEIDFSSVNFAATDVDGALEELFSDKLSGATSDATTYNIYKSETSNVISFRGLLSSDLTRITLSQGTNDITIDATSLAVRRPKITASALTLYDPALGADDLFLRFTSGAAVSFRVPSNATVAHPQGTTITYMQYGAGTVTAIAGGGATLRAPGGASTRTQFSVVSCTKIGTNEWVVYGDTA